MVGVSIKLDRGTYKEKSNDARGIGNDLLGIVGTDIFFAFGEIF